MRVGINILCKLGAIRTARPKHGRLNAFFVANSIGCVMNVAWCRMLSRGD